MTALKVHGTDLSHHNADPDYRRAKSAGLLWSYHKATEGSTLVDSRYAARRAMARDAMLPFGAYHFARPDDNHKDAKLEANRFMRIARPVAGDLAPALDFEVGREHLSESWCKTFMTEVERLLKVAGLEGRPVHYGPDDFGPDYNYLRWVPRYNLDNRRPDVPWDIFQFSGGSQFPGTPSTFAGLGPVDLNYMANGTNLPDFRLTAKPRPEPKKYDKVYVGHWSLQYSDTTEQQRHDVVKMFARALKKDYAWLSGTEAGPSSDLWALIEAEADKAGYRAFRPATDSWIAVKKDRIKAGSWSTHYEKIIDGEAKRWGPKGVVAASWDDKVLGVKVTVITSHYLTKGRPGKLPAEFTMNLAENQRLANAISAYAVKMGKGTDLVFYGGDQNIVDSYSDTFLGGPLTSTWDELGKYENTGHGNIDVIGSYDKDTRVKATYVGAMTDREYFLHGDHFPVESAFDIEQLAA